MRVVLSRSLWIEGSAAQAKSVAIEALKLANEDSPYAIGLTLGLSACPIALWSGLDTEAAALTLEILDRSDRYGLAVWHHWGRLFDMILRHAEEKCRHVWFPP
jgi:hypothetical protein